MNTEHFPLRQLTDQFYEENGHLERVMDKRKDATEYFKKDRGYGVILIEAYGQRFGIPLRSNMTHKFCFSTKITSNPESGRTQRKGLDYTKAVILNEGHYVTERSFKIPADEFDKINDSQEMIKNQFTKFIEKYIKAVEKNDQNVLSRNYRDSSLINYHKELGIENKDVNSTD
ncbi:MULTISPECIES: type III toxin-antitoxin system TenpIN family toxin [Exiguobacterium]|uniref:Uncharacterized protein n=1 Tax=Exiguobacterium acetylicum TaxID=41170 RepID=A0ABX8GDZ5_EXIAC|nr:MULTISPECIES: hypothetical protein [Exiguobacterium]QWB31880.1 hypothetical protein KKI46_16675 [Exiguobacterium acetylicum]